MNGVEDTRNGNRQDTMAPHGVYRCNGDDAWASIAVGTDDEWRGLGRAMGEPPWAKERRFADAYQRWTHQDELDRLIEAWTIGFTPAEVTDLLQSVGVAAMPSMSARALLDDPHLQARHMFAMIEQLDLGQTRAVAPPWRLSKTPAAVNKWSPALGENNIEVFTGILDLATEEVEALQETKVIW